MRKYISDIVKGVKNMFRGELVEVTLTESNGHIHYSYKKIAE